MLTQKEVWRGIGKEKREKKRKSTNAYYKRKMDGFSLLKKWVPGTETLSQPELFEKTVNFIKELLNKIKELETSQTVMDTDCTDSAQPLMPQEMAVSTPMEIPVSSDEEKLLKSPEEEFLVSPEEEMELLASGDEEELPEFNCIEDLRQWLGL
jgi:hypothetical protein